MTRLAVVATGGRELGSRSETIEGLITSGVPARHGFFDKCCREPVQFSLGHMMPTETFRFGHLGAFGAPGAGGSMGYADPQTGIGCGYVTSRIGTHLEGDPRDVALRAAVPAMLLHPSSNRAASQGRGLKELTEILLPEPIFQGTSSFEASLRERRSVREFSSASLSLVSVGQLLWAAQGLTAPTGERTAPSAGALYPLEFYLVVGRVDDCPPGAYRYQPHRHALRLHFSGDRRRCLAEAALGQTAIKSAAAVLVATAVYRRTAVKYGSRGNRYVHMEVGHAAQNVYLQAQSLGLGTVTIGAFEDESVRDVLALPPNETPLALLPVGARRSRRA